MTAEFEWVDEIPKRTGGGKAGGGKYQTLAETLKGAPGKVAKLGPFSVGAGSGATRRLKDLGVDATSRTVDGKVFVYAVAEGENDDNSESIFEDGE